MKVLCCLYQLLRCDNFVQSQVEKKVWSEVKTLRNFEIDSFFHCCEEESEMWELMSVTLMTSLNEVWFRVVLPALSAKVVLFLSFTCSWCFFDREADQSV